MKERIDIDAGYDPEDKEHGTLDQYRQKRMKEVKQPGFGKKPQPAVKPVEEPQPETEAASETE